MTKILMVGDSHGNLAFMEHIIHVAEYNKIKTVVQLGDFGFIWPGADNELAALNEIANEHSIKIVFIPGNHEDWDSLDYYHAKAEKELSYDVDGFIPILSNIVYTGKTHQWEWDGLIFTAVGGAYSIDYALREYGRSIWVQETLTEEDLLRVESFETTDVLLTHDAPTWAPFRNLYDDIESHIHRQKMNRVQLALLPSVWFHGHYHTKMTYEDYITKVYGLNCDGAWDESNYMIFDTKTAMKRREINGT